jgi:hypothetical protein
MRTGGGFYFTKPSDFSQDGTGDSTDTIPFTEMQQEVTEVGNCAVNTPTNSAEGLAST